MLPTNTPVVGAPSIVIDEIPGDTLEWIEDGFSLFPEEPSPLYPHHWIDPFVGNPITGPFAVVVKKFLTLVNAPLSVFLLQFRHAMGHSAIIEEPVFRGVLWGYLRKKGWRDQRILWFQTVLFWFAHVRHYSKPHIFLITMPLGALLFGWLAWKSKTLAGSLLAHGLFNASSIFLCQYSANKKESNVHNLIV